MMSTTSTVTSSGAPTPIARVRMSSMSGEQHRAGYFEREFVEIDDLGSGEFGKVIKARRKAAGADGEIFAVKQSRQFEGTRQR
jgi:mitosis inhibitor protein kinase SWE1